MPIPFSDARALIEDASEMRVKFNEAMNQHEVGKVTAVFDPTINKYRHIFHVLELTDPRMKVLARGIIGNLRSALDYMTVDCARLNGATDLKVEFPFAQDLESLRKVMKKKCAGVPDVIQDYSYPLNLIRTVMFICMS